jgi:hypothetical protein
MFAGFSHLRSGFPLGKVERSSVDWFARMGFAAWPHEVKNQTRNQHQLLKIFVFRNSLRNLPCGSCFLLNCINSGILL